MQDSKRPWHRPTSNITSLDISSTHAQAYQIINNGIPQAASKVTFQEIQADPTADLDDQKAVGFVTSGNSKTKRSLYKRINSIKENCILALELETEANESTFTGLELPQSYRDHI